MTLSRTKNPARPTKTARRRTTKNEAEENECGREALSLRESPIKGERLMRIVHLGFLSLLSTTQVMGIHYTEKSKLEPSAYESPAGLTLEQVHVYVRHGLSDALDVWHNELNY